MKFIVLLLAVLALVYLLRASVRRMRQPPPSQSGKADADANADAPTQMLSCAQCGLHLPAGEALPGRGGVFCGAPHRAAYEAEHPRP